MKHINLTQMLQGCSKRNGMTVRASNPDGEPTVNRQSRLMSLSCKKVEKEQLSSSCLLSASFPLSFRSRYLRYAAMIFCVLTMSVGQAWGTEETLFSTDFSSSDWSGKTFSQGNTTTPHVYNGITFYCKSGSTQFAVDQSAGEMTWCSNNMGSNNYFLAIPITGINNGTITITANWVAVSKKSPKLAWDVKNGATSVVYSGLDNGNTHKVTGSAGGTVTTITIDTIDAANKSAVVYLGRGSSDCTKLTSITITTPAAPANTYYYRGSDNSWGATAMTPSEGGTYEYIASTASTNRFQIALSTSSYDYNHSYNWSGFFMTDQDINLGDFSSNDCYIWEAPSSYYIIVFKPSTAVNNSSNPHICVSRTLPDDSPSGLAATKTVYLDPGVWEASGAKYAVCYVDHNGEWSDFMTASPCFDGVYQTTIPAWVSNVEFVRFNSTAEAGDISYEGGKCWNYSGHLNSMPSGAARFTVAQTGATWNDLNTSNWSTPSIPTYTISYAKGSTTYTGGNAISGSKDSETKTCDEDFTLPSSAVFTATGYRQTGWATTDGGSKAYNLGGSYTTDAAQPFYPFWTVNSHTLTWNLAGGKVTTAGTQALVDATGSPSGSVNYGTTVTAPVVTKTGYTFNAWSPTVVSPMPDEDKTYTATWTEIVPSSVTLNKSSTTITVGGGTETLTATVLPDNALDKSITWTSSDEDVATVDDGVVTAVAAGTATITATTVNDMTATCEVTVAAAEPVDCPTSGIIYNMTMLSKVTSDNLAINHGTEINLGANSYATVTNGSAVFRNNDESSDDKAYITKNNPNQLQFKGNQTYLHLSFDCPLQTGDSIIVTWVSGPEIAFSISTTSAIGSADSTKIIDGKHCFIVPAKWDGEDDIYCWRSRGKSVYIKGLKVVRPVSCTSVAAPTALTCSAQTSSSLTFTWTEAANASGYVASLYDNSACTGDPVASSVLGDVATVTFSTLTASTTYYCQVQSKGDGSTYCATGGTTSAASGTTDADTPVGTTYYLVTSTAQLNTTDTYVIMADDKSAMMGVATDDNAYLNAITSGFTAAADKSTVTVTSSDVNTLTLQAESSAWNIVGKNDKKLSTKGTVDGKLYANTDKATTSGTDDFVFSFADGKATIKRSTEANYHIYYTSGTGFNQSTTATNIRLYTSNSTPVYTVTYDLNGGTGTVPTNRPEKSGTVITLASSAGLTNDGFTFDGWLCNVNSTKYNAGASYTMTAANTTFTAQWVADVDVTAPTLSSSTPADDATGVGVSGNIVLTFSENVTINDASKFSLTGGAGTLNTASASASGADVTIPYTGLAYNTTYTLATAAEAVKDGSNNKNAALSDITFTTLSATGSCNELNYVWQTGSSKTPKGVSKTYAEGDVAKIDNDDVATTHITISGINYEQKSGSKGSLNTDKATDNYFLLTAASGYVIDSVYFYGKLEDGACRMSTDGSAWTTTLGDGTSTGEKVYAIGVGTQYFGLKNKDIASPKGVWIRTMMVKVCPEGTTYTVSYDANGHGSAPDAETDIDPGSTISAPSAPTADCWTFNGWYKDRACTNVWNFAEDEVNSNITLYAKWTSNKARVKALDYGETDYTVNPAGTGDDITVTPVSASGVTYKWYSNTSDDVSTWSEIPSAETASYSPSIAVAGTKYYWAVLVHDCGNDTTSSVRINVAASKTEPTIVWGNVQRGGVDATPTYGGGGYTLTGTINGGADATPTLDASMISADGGIVITAKSVNDASKTFSLTFDMTAAFDTTQAKITNIHFSLPSNSTYNDSVFSTNLSFDKCSGGSYSTDVYVVGYTNATGTSTSSSANKALKVAKSWISTASPSFTDKTSADGFSISATRASYYWKQSNQTIISTTTGATMIMYKVGKNSCTIEWTTSSLSFSKVRIIGRNESADPSTVTVSNGTEEKTFTFAGGKQGELQIQEVSMEFVHGSKKGVRLKGDGAKEISAIIELVPTGSDGAGTGTATTLQWKSGKAPSDISGWDGSAKKIVKAQSDDDFTCVAEQTSATNSVGAITYASDNTDVATVNETTGEVDIVAGAAGGEATITATMARSGCFMRSTISYTISVAELACAIEPGTLTASATSKCNLATVTLTLSDYTSTGTTISWYKSGTAEPLTNGGAYTIGGATLTTAQEGTYYAKVTLEETGCSLSSNNVTITNKGGAASVSKLVNQWYIKKGRVTPDIALWRLGEGSSYVPSSAKADGVALTDQLGGCTVIARDSTIYLSGGDPTGISAVGDVSLTVQVQDECGKTTTSDPITIHKQVATDKHELAFVTTGTNYKEKEFTEDAWTAGIKAANSTGLALYQVLKDTFKIQATNIYASDDEKKLREYYSQYDLICITDYPNTGTKGKNGKSYVDAIGSLIDIRPVLTMEAWVSGLDNWRNKGVVGTRTTPSKRQYNMYLQCKDHEIFEGVKMQQIGYGDDALFKVNMVDSTQSRYAQLDAVGKDSHATDTAALQGFTTGDMDLLALGLIDNGSGTNLQVGAERQTVMAARMMVLGINSYAMERLSDDGMRIIVNALQYLTKKRADDISDCSTYFTNAAGDSLWENSGNWRSGTLPVSNQEVRILKPVVISDSRKIASLKIVVDGTFHGIEANGSLTIAPTGTLIVESKIQSAIGPDVLSGYPTETSHITIQTDNLHQGALIFDNSKGDTRATVDLYSKGCNDGSYKFQYFASPFMDISSWAFGDAYIYTHDESLNPEWTQLHYGEDVSAFQGLSLTADGSATNYTIAGTLASTNPHTYNLTYTGGKAKKRGTNVIGNSWSAPIQITRIDDSDFDNPSNFEGIIYIYNAGRDVLVDGNVYASNGNAEQGQWQSIPVDLAKTEEWEHKRQIPAFQAFQMKVNAATEFTLDYNKHVRQEASIGVNNYNEPLHAPRRSMRSEAVKVLRLCVEDEQVGKSYIYLCEGDQFTEERDRGWEAQQTIGSGKYGKLYAIDQATDYMMSIARESLEGTPVGFISGLSTEYTITFNETEGTYYLNDLETQQSTLIQEGESYTFTTTKGNHPNRFIISATPFDKSGIATGVTDLDAEAPKVQKVIYNDKLYIIRGGKVFSADGQLVK